MLPVRYVRKSHRVRSDFKGPKLFCGWDGEGTANRSETDRTQRYSLFGCTEPDWSPLIAEQLSSFDILTYLADAAEKLMPRIHVAFGFGYDVDMILRDVPDELIVAMKPREREGKPLRTVSWEGFDIKYMPRKWFSVRRHGGPWIRIYETVAYFMTSLMGAAREYIADDHPLFLTLNYVLHGKESRDVFTFEDMESLIEPYWRAEGNLFIGIMDKLRESIDAAGIPVTEWHGPGAIAGAMLKQRGMGRVLRASRDSLPSNVLNATRYAYFGGRSECLITGDTGGPVYSADLRSAYPAAMSMLPGIDDSGIWLDTTDFTDIDPWALYQVDWMIYDDSLTRQQYRHLISPFPVRMFSNGVLYPPIGRGWYFGSEVAAALRHPYYRDHMQINREIRYVPSGSETTPLAWVAEVYELRAQYKRDGNPAQLALKLGLNSLYGKLAQVRGWLQTSHGPKLPTYYHPYYGGAITAWCRAKIMNAMIDVGLQNVIAVETDGIYTRKPLPYNDVPELGGWEMSEYDRMVYIQSGTYIYQKGDEWYSRTRGFGKGTITPIIDVKRQTVDPTTVLDSLPTLAPMTTNTRRYGSMTNYLGKPLRHTWFDLTKVMSWGGLGKRMHREDLCYACNDQQTDLPTTAHRTVHVQPSRVFEPSYPRIIPWMDNVTESLAGQGMSPSEDWEYYE